MKSPDTCFTCGSSLPAGGVCPACLLKTGMEAETVPFDAEDFPDEIDDTGDAPTVIGVSAAPAPREAIGTMIGRYRLLKEIGEGGFGIVYMAEQSEPVIRRVALKVLKPGMDTREVVARFEAERQALAVMDHPNIAQVFDGGATDSGRPYFVMELVKGVPVTKYCDHYRLTIRPRLELFLDVLLAVQHAHQKGVIHRDLKPSNILVTMHDGKPVIKVIDFGIAKAVGPEVTPRTVVTSFGQMIGTPQYMSPEQAEVNARDVDTRSDIYSLGIVLYELLTGRTPLDSQQIRGTGCIGIQRLIRDQESPKPSTKFDTLAAGDRTSVARRRGAEPSKLAGLLRADLDWVVMKSLEKDRARRYQTANALAMDIRRFLDDEPVSASPPSTVYRFTKFTRRHKFGVAWTAVISVVILTAAVGMTLLYFRAQHETEIAQIERKKAVDAEMRAQRRAWVALAALRSTGKPGRRFEALETLREAAAHIDDYDAASMSRIRDAAIACFSIVDMQAAETWPGNPGRGAMVAADHALTSYACTFPDGRISIRRYPDKTGVAEFPGGSQPVNWVLQFSPDGNRLAAGYGTEAIWKLKLWNLRGGTMPLAAGLCLNKAFDFFPDGRRCVAGRPDGDKALLDLIDVASGASLKRIPLGAIPHSVSISRDGKLIAVSLMKPGSVLVLDAETGTVIAEPAVPQPRALAWSPFDESLAVCSADSLVRVWHDREWKEPALELRGHTNVVDAVSWSPDGRLLASQSWDGTTRLWDPCQGTPLTWYSGRGGNLRFSADGTKLGFLREGESLTILEIAPGEICYRGRAHSGATGTVAGAWNPEGTLMATAGDDGIRFWNREGRHLGHLKLSRSRGVAFSSDSLYVTSVAGLHRLRMEKETTGDGCVVKLGSPEVIGAYHFCEQLSLAPDGSLLALADRQSDPGDGTAVIWLVDLKGGREPRRLRAPAGAAYCAISADGKWLAAGTWKGEGVRIWPLPEAGSFHDLPVPGSATVAFSPDVRWLVTGDTEAYRFWKTGSWEMEHRIPSEMGEFVGEMAFSPRQTALAIACRRTELKVLHPVTLEEMITPDFDRESPLCFDPTGMLMVNTGQAGIFFWKLDAVRASLVKLGLDWPKLPPFPPVVLPVVCRVSLTAPAH